MNQYLRRKIWTLNRSGKFRGYLRTVSGYPVTLTDCMAGQPVSMAVDGNAVQDGTPTPDNPVDVQLCGDRTVNLFDKKHASNIDNWKFSISKDSGYYELQGIANGETITIALKLNSSLAVNSIIMVYTYDDVYKTGFNPQTTELQTKTITYADGDKLRIYVPGINGAVNNYMNLVNADLQIIRGSYTADTLPAYEPYGYKVPLTMTGMNLLSNNENDWVSNMGTYKYFTIPVEGTTTLQVKIKEGKSIPEDLYLGYTKNGINTTGGLVWLIDNGIFYGAPIRTSELKYISIHPKTALLDEIFDSLDIMLIEGAYTAETIPAYEPYREPQTFNIYTPQQLAKVGDTADTVVLDFDNKTAKLVNAVGIDVLSAYSTRETLDDVCGFFCLPVKYDILQNSNVGVTNRFVCKYGYRENIEKAFIAKYDSNPKYVLNIAKTRIGYTEEDTSDTLVQKANDWLSENETYGLYSIATPITTDITALQDWDAMPSLWSGTAVITADTVIAPSAITAKYYASKPEEVN